MKYFFRTKIKDIVLIIFILMISTNYLYAYSKINKLKLKPNIIAIISQKSYSKVHNKTGRYWEIVKNKKITKFNHGGDWTYAIIEVYNVPSNMPNYVQIGYHQGHLVDSKRIEYGEYIVGYRFVYLFYGVDSKNKTENMKVVVDNQLVDTLSIK